MMSLPKQSLKWFAQQGLAACLEAMVKWLEWSLAEQEEHSSIPALSIFSCNGRLKEKLQT